MCVSLERLFCLTSQQAISIAPVAGGKGIFSREDAAGVIAMVQHVNPIGVKVLEAKIGGNHNSCAELAHALTATFEARNVNPAASKALAFMAVTEVCSAHRCPKCNGVGSIDWRGRPCRACQGLGFKHIRTVKHMAATFNGLSGLKISEQQFSQIYYDVYMEAIDELYQQEGEAAKYAAAVLRIVQREVEYES